MGESDWNRKNRDRTDKIRAEVAQSARVLVDVYRVDAILLRKGWRPACAGTKTHRGKVKGYLSSRSRRNLVFKLNNSDVRMRSMLTLTMSPLCHGLVPPHVHRYAFSLVLQRLRDKGIRDYIWVREFQQNGSVHWHVFTSLQVGSPGQINEELSFEWRDWWCDLYWRKIIGEPKTKKAKKKFRLSEWHMRNGNRDDFKGACRFEELKTEAAGRYAAKEGSKTVQKLCPAIWLDAGGSWWDCSKTIKCTPISRARIDSSRLQTTSIEIKGATEEIAFTLQQNLGLKLLTERKRKSRLPLTR